ncbi:MAG: type II secretion system F family protein, partial [Planctomycetota bacterium]
MSRLFRRLAIGYGAGIDLKTIYSREIEFDTPRYREKSRQVLLGVSKGLTLAESMKATDGYFPDLVLAIVNAGEQGGRLEESFSKLADHYDSLVKFRNGFLLSIAWPLFELFFAVSIIGAVILLLGWLVNDEAANWFGMGSAMANFLF